MENLDELMKKYPLNNMEESKDLRDYTSDNLVSSLPIESECKDIDFEWEYPIFDQSKKGNVGSCCGHGGAAVEDFIFNVNPVDEDLFSPYWLYAYREPIYHQGHGMFESDITRNLTKIGGVKLKDFDYPGIEYPAIKEKINEIGIDKLLKIAANYRLESYIHIKPSEVKGWLNEHGTIGFVIVKAYENFYESLNNGGHFPKEGKGKCIGSHCMPFKGVVDGKLKMPNSWGPNVGDKGIGLFYWECAWIPVGKTWAENEPIWSKYGSGWASKYAAGYDHEIVGDYSYGSAVDNQAFFNFNGYPMDSINVFKYIYTGATPSIGEGGMTNGGYLGDLTTIEGWQTVQSEYEMTSETLTVRSTGTYSMFYHNNLPTTGGSTFIIEGYVTKGGANTWVSSHDIIYLRDNMIDDTHFSIELRANVTNKVVNFQTQLRADESGDTEIVFTKIYLK